MICSEKMSSFLLCQELGELGLGHTSAGHTARPASKSEEHGTRMVTNDSDSPLAEQDSQENSDFGSTHYEQGCAC